MKTVRIIAPAKVNLLLGIGARRSDGYHDACTIMHALAMHDIIEMKLFESGEHLMVMEPVDEAQPLRQVEVDVAAGSGLDVHAKMLWRGALERVDVPDESNLACKAVRALAHALGRTHDEQVRMVVEKNIPHQTGLGGGSADAAAALLGAAHVWGVAADDDRVVQTAQDLGADVRFFLQGGCALLDGRGDVLQHALNPRRDTVVVVKPEGGVPTAQAYATFDANPREVPAALLEQAARAQDAAEVALFNNLEAAAVQLLPELASVQEFLAQAEGVQGHLLCGSGAGVFAVCQSYGHAQDLAAAAQARGWWVRITSFAPIGAAVVPA